MRLREDDPPSTAYASACGMFSACAFAAGWRGHWFISGFAAAVAAWLLVCAMRAFAQECRR